MFGSALIFFIVAIIARVLGFTGIAAQMAGIAQIIFTLLWCFLSFRWYLEPYKERVYCKHQKYPYLLWYLRKNMTASDVLETLLQSVNKQRDR
ncbi:MAG: DUF1328 domain-containing protein [Saprospiraceae bacterium]|nr:DUF1328 domain-containing protein [Saprospiraceae bacterium]